MSAIIPKWDGTTMDYGHVDGGEAWVELTTNSPTAQEAQMKVLVDGDQWIIADLDAPRARALIARLAAFADAAEQTAALMPEAVRQAREAAL